MATYLIKQEYRINRQEGDNANIQFVVPDTLSMTGRTATFKVFDDAKRAIITKTSAEGLTITDQQIEITLLPADTKSKAGMHRWELELTTPEIITIGRGIFQIIPENII